MVILKTYLKAALIGLLIPVSALAGLPPPTATGQSETSKVTTFNLQLPNNQLTTTGSGTRLAETGNGQLLKNPSFEASTYSTDWTISNSTGSQESTTIVAGAGLHGAKLSLSAQSGDLLVQSVTPTGKLTGTNYEATCSVYTTLATIQLCSLVGGVEQQCSTVPSSGVFSTVTTNTPGLDGSSVGLKVKATSSSTGSVYVDDCYVGKARNIVQTTVNTPWSTQYSLTPVNFASLTSSNYMSRREADSIHFKGYITPSGTGAAATASLQLPSSLVIDSTKIRSNSNGTRVGTADNLTLSATSILPGEEYVIFYDGSTTDRVFFSIANNASATYSKMNGNSTSNGGQYLDFDFSVPVSGWSAMEAVTPSQQRAPNIVKYTSGSGTYTPTAGATYIKVRMVGAGAGGSGGGAGTPGLGSNGGDSTFGSSLLVAGGGKAPTAQANSGVGGTASLGTGPIGTAASGGYGSPGVNSGGAANGTSGGSGGSSLFGGSGAGGNNNGGLIAGQAGVANTGAGGGGGYAASSTGVSGGGGGAGGFVEAIISTPASSYSYAIGSSGAGGAAGTSGAAGGSGGSGYIEITEYFGQTAPILTGSITSNGSNAKRTEYVSVAADGACTLSFFPGDPIWATSSHTASGECTFTFSGTPSSAPKCQATGVGGSNTNISCSSKTSSGMICTQRAVNSAGAVGDAAFDLSCTWTR